MKYWRHYCNNNKNPNEIVMDNSSALILASVQSFTSYLRTVEYLNGCFEKLFDTKFPSNVSRVDCFIRLDRSHIVKQIMRMKSINNQDRSIKDIIRRVLGFLITVDDIEDVKDIISNLFILLLNKYEYVKEVTDAKWRIKSLCEKHVLNDDRIEADVNEQEEANDLLDIAGGGENKFRAWIKNIISDVRVKFVNENMNESIDCESQKKSCLQKIDTSAKI